jgi:hypothetical protein
MSPVFGGSGANSQVIVDVQNLLVFPLVEPRNLTLVLLKIPTANIPLDLCPGALPFVDDG